MKPKILWKAKQLQKNTSNLFRYEKFLFSKYKFKVTQNYSKLLLRKYRNIHLFVTPVS